MYNSTFEFITTFQDKNYSAITNQYNKLFVLIVITDINTKCNFEILNILEAHTAISLLSKEIENCC